jgi:hypothetical protein
VPLTADPDNEENVTLSLDPREKGFRFITVFLPHGRVMLIQIDETRGKIRQAMKILGTLEL